MSRWPRLVINLCAIPVLAGWVLAGVSWQTSADGPGAGGDFVLESSVLDDGVSAMSSAQYVVQGSFGQPTANGLSTSGDLQADLGFWATFPSFQVYLPIVTK